MYVYISVSCSIQCYYIFRCYYLNSKFTLVQFILAYARYQFKEIKMGKTDYHCKFCRKRFSTVHSLKRHIHTVHEGNKDYKCESCSKSFFQSGSLNKHTYTVHEGHRDFKCKFCGKSFSQEGTLKIHINTVHENEKNMNVNCVTNTFLRKEA